MSTYTRGIVTEIGLSLVRNAAEGYKTIMPHAIIRGKNGRRHEVNFGDEAVRVEIHASGETVEIFIGADFETLPEERRRFALLNIPRHLFSEATATVARRTAKSRATGFRQPG